MSLECLLFVDLCACVAACRKCQTGTGRKGARVCVCVCAHSRICTLCVCARAHICTMCVRTHIRIFVHCVCVRTCPYLYIVCVCERACACTSDPFLQVDPNLSVLEKHIKQRSGIADQVVVLVIFVWLCQERHAHPSCTPGRIFALSSLLSPRILVPSCSNASPLSLPGASSTSQTSPRWTQTQRPRGRPVDQAVVQFQQQDLHLSDHPGEQCTLEL